jgi:hypothetical protein
MQGLAIFALCGFPASVIVFVLAVRHVKHAGTLDHL